MIPKNDSFRHRGERLISDVRPRPTATPFCALWANYVTSGDASPRRNARPVVDTNHALGRAKFYAVFLCARDRSVPILRMEQAIFGPPFRSSPVEKLSVVCAWALLSACWP